MQQKQLEYIRPRALTPCRRNTRTHSKKQVRQIAQSIEVFGFTNPILIDSGNTILAGHARLAAAKSLDMEFVPCVRLENMTPEQKRAYALADNKLAMNAGWDEPILAEELQTLIELDAEFDVSVTGFEIAEIDALIEGLEPGEARAPEDDKLPDVDPQHVVSQPGDLWVMGPHRLLCGDALSRDTYETLLGRRRAQMVFTDPPYNVPINGHVSGLGRTKHRAFEMANGEMSDGEFGEFLRKAFEHMADFSVDGAIHFVCMDWRHIGAMLTAGGAVYSELKNLIVWAKDNAGMGSFYRSRHELIFAFKNGTAAHINSFELGQHGRNRSNVWSYRGMNGFAANRMDQLKLHPTVKPVDMLADAIKDVSRRGCIVLDPFAGSGSTLIAAHKTGRRAYLAEMDPVYVDRIVRRWQSYAHDEAIHSDGTRFNDRVVAEGQATRKASA